MAGVVVVVMIIGALFLGVFLGANSSEIAECKQWQEYAAKYQGFYLVNWQKEQCEAQGVEVNAPVI